MAATGGRTRGRKPGGAQGDGPQGGAPMAGRGNDVGPDVNKVGGGGAAGLGGWMGAGEGQGGSRFRWVDGGSRFRWVDGGSRFRWVDGGSRFRWVNGCWSRPGGQQVDGRVDGDKGVG